MTPPTPPTPPKRSLFWDIAGVLITLLGVFVVLSLKQAIVGLAFVAFGAGLVSPDRVVALLGTIKSYIPGLGG